MDAFKSASLKIQYSLGINDGKELKRMKVYNNISEEVTEEQVSNLKDLIENLGMYSVIFSELVTTKLL